MGRNTKGFGDFIDVPNRPDEIRINCPFCVSNGRSADENHHCYVNTKKGLFNCFRCEARGSTNRLQGKYGLLQKISHDLDSVKDRIKKMTNWKKTKTIDLSEFSRPLTIERTPIAWKYMRDRGFSADEIVRYDLRVGRMVVDETTGKEMYRWANRIIFPFYDSGNVVFVVARTYTGKTPKYINSLGSKSLVVYGIDDIKDRTILCEGIISAIAAERNTNIPSVSVLGKTITRLQMSKLRSRCKKVYVCLDGDCTRREKNLLNRQLIATGFEVWEINLPKGKDPDDLGPQFKAYFRRARRVKLL